MTDTLIAHTPLGDLHKGDIVWHRRYNRAKREHVVEWAVVSDRSSLSPALVFGRNEKDKPRVIRLEDITRIARKENSDA